jgi:transposase
MSGGLGHLTYQSEQIILNVLEYFEKEKQNQGSLISVMAPKKRTYFATGISETTLTTIIQRHENKDKIPKKRKRICSKTKDVDESVQHEIRNVIYDTCAAKEHITLDSLLQKIKQKQIIDIGRTSLLKLIKSIGFVYSKDSKQRGLCEKPHIVRMRVNFLREYVDFISAPSRYTQMVFLDETWIFQRGESKKTWHDDSIKRVRDSGQSSNGKRYMIVHAGTKDGFVENAGRIFACHSNSQDYHENMNHEFFENWFLQLLQSLSEPSIIILDNASYHSRISKKQPTSSWTKGNIVNWLKENNIQFPEKSFKVELLNIARNNRKEKEYIVDEMAYSYVHKVLRLPPYHCQFNPIELIWGITKNYYDRHIGRDGYAENNVVEMWEEALRQITPEMWRNSVRHTEDKIKEWWDREQLLEDHVQPLIFVANTGESSSEFDSDDD